ncbi:MAG: hypothetical protein OEY56_10570 [Cyclobacteriaceae bacterium]|nr:hypothetical protein [Cyclobacteriaceae bacterium]
MIRSSLAILLILYSAFLAAQATGPCSSGLHRQFDFWIGDWNVYDTLGNPVGESRIEYLEDGCVLGERWIGRQGYTGRSLNYVSGKDTAWHQLWVDNQGGQLQLSGGIRANTMVLESNWQVSADQARYRDRICWWQVGDGSVVQLWERLDDKGGVIIEVFRGIYRKK